MASKSILLSLLFNIMFLNRTHADLIPNLRMLDLGMASAQSPAPSDPGIASVPSPECPEPSPAPLDAGMASAPSPECPTPSPAPLDPCMASAPSPAPLDPCMASAPNPAFLDECVAPAPNSGPYDLGIDLSPTHAPLNLNCSSCPTDPFGLAACGFLISGNILPDTIDLCCTTLSSLSKQDASACLCSAIEMKAVKFGDYDITDALNKVLAACNIL